MLNSVIIMGRLVRDPELRTTQDGVSVATFRVAVERDMTNRATGKKETDFIDCVAWRQTGEFVGKFFTKGRMICVMGRLEGRRYTDKEGKERTAWEVKAERCEFCGDSPRDQRSVFEDRKPAPRQAPKLAADFAALDDDSELPFV